MAAEERVEGGAVMEEEVMEGGATEEEETTQSLAKFPQNLFLLSHSI